MRAALAKTLARFAQLRAPHGVRFSAPQNDMRAMAENAIARMGYGGGAAENRTPVHGSLLIGISRLSRWFGLGRCARSDTLAAPQSVRS